MRRLSKTWTPWARGVMLPLGAHLSNGTSGFFLGAGGGSRTHFSHHSGCLLRVATRRVCSPSPEPIGLRWTSQPRPRMAPGEDDESAANRISLMKRPTNSLGSAGTVNSIQRLSRLSPQSFIGRSRRDSKISRLGPLERKTCLE